MSKKFKDTTALSNITRRGVLAGAGAAAAVAVTGFPAVIAADRSLKVGAYGGYFKDS